MSGTGISNSFKSLVRQDFDPVEVREKLVERRESLLESINETLSKYSEHAASGKISFTNDRTSHRSKAGDAQLILFEHESKSLKENQIAIMALEEKRFSYDGTCLNKAPISMNPTNQSLEKEVIEAMKKEEGLPGHLITLHAARSDDTIVEVNDIVPSGK